MRIPTLETERLLIREFDVGDLATVHQLLDVELAETDLANEVGSLSDRQAWLQWTVLGYEQLSRLHQPPYGDRAIVLQPGQQIIGACGLVPCLDAYEQLPELRLHPAAPQAYFSVAEVGLYWAIAPAHQRLGYATEAVRCLVAYAFSALNLQRIIATTDYSNAASMAVMRKLGMRVGHNPNPDPAWLQVVGVMER